MKLAVLILFLFSTLCYADTDTNTKNLSPFSSEETELNLPEALVGSTYSNISQIVSLIRDEKFSNASEIFKLFSDGDNMLPDITTTVYANNLENLGNIFSFVRKLPYCRHDEKVFSTLLSDMRQNEHHRKPEIVLLVGSVKQCDNQLKQVKTNIQRYVADVISVWARQIQFGEYDHIKQFFKKYGTSSRHALNLILPELVKVTYAGSIVNMDALLKFLRNLPNTADDVVGYPALFAEMKESEEEQSYQDIFKLALRVNESLGFIKSDQDFKKTLTDLKNEFPSVIQKIVWGHVCTIKNVFYGEYLYPSVYTVGEEPGERNVFTWTLKNTFAQARWKFETKDGIQFQIINEYWQSRGNENVFLVMDTGEKFDDDRRNIRTAKEKNSHKSIMWNLEPVAINHTGSDSKGIFYLRSGWENHFLYAGNNTFKVENDRKVFALVGTRAVPTAANWEIDCT